VLYKGSKMKEERQVMRGLEDRRAGAILIVQRLRK